MKLELRYCPRVIGYPGGLGVGGQAWVQREIEIVAGSTPEGTAIMVPKAECWAIRLEALKRPQAHILKESILSIGGDCAIHKDVITDRIERSPAVVIANWKQLKRLQQSLARQPFGLRPLGELILDTVRRFKGLTPYRECVLRLPGGQTLDVSPGARTLVMGIVNVTPDSFSDGGRHATLETALAHAERLIADGADILDIGGESTRPGADPVSTADQVARIVPVIADIARRWPQIPISVDASDPIVVQQSLDTGARLINDVLAAATPAPQADSDAPVSNPLSNNELQRRRAMAELAVAARVPYIVMHMQGAPRTMQRDPTYADCTGEVVHALRDATARLVDTGLARDQVVLDPGFGFGKTVDHNRELLARLPELRSLGQPVLVGLSRKSSLGAISAATMGKDAPPSVDDRLPESLAAAVIAALHGASIVRVHDVRETRKALAIANAM